MTDSWLVALLPGCSQTCCWCKWHQQCMYASMQQLHIWPHFWTCYPSLVYVSSWRHQHSNSDGPMEIFPEVRNSHRLVKTIVRKNQHQVFWMLKFISSLCQDISSDQSCTEAPNSCKEMIEKERKHFFSSLYLSRLPSAQHWSELRGLNSSAIVKAEANAGVFNIKGRHTHREEHAWSKRPTRKQTPAFLQGAALCFAHD